MVQPSQDEDVSEVQKSNVIRKAILLLFYVVFKTGGKNVENLYIYIFLHWRIIVNLI